LTAPSPFGNKAAQISRHRGRKLKTRRVAAYPTIMRTHKLSRRDALARTGLLASAAVAAEKLARAEDSEKGRGRHSNGPFSYCLNTATIRGQKLGIVKEIEIAAKAGYDAIEPWVDSLENYVKEGGTAKDLGQRFSDAGLTLESAIGFPEWIVDDEARRAQGLERAKREMDLVAQAGGKRLAAPPAGATELPKLDFGAAVERYRALLQAGDEVGLVPQLELWGFSKNLHRLGECLGVAMETGHPKACVLADVYHLYKGGSDFHGIRLLGPEAIQVVHMNDYPAEPPRDKIDDSHRVYPGDGVAPIAEILRLLQRTGGRKVLSLELFSRQYWAQDALTVAKDGLAKMKGVAQRAMAKD
jgi:2-keto-myo-inositol isomerase